MEKVKLLFISNILFTGPYMKRQIAPPMLKDFKLTLSQPTKGLDLLTHRGVHDHRYRPWR
jgi:hypothetical protein